MEINLTPDFEAMFEQMMREAQAQAVVWRNNQTGFDQPVDAAVAGNMRAIQRWFWPLAMAAQTMTNVTAIERFRALMAEILADIDKTAAQLEAAHVKERAFNQLIGGPSDEQFPVEEE